MLDPDASNLVFALSATLDTALLGDVESLAEARRLTRGTGVRLLENEVARVRATDRAVSIAGLTLDYWSPEARRAQVRLERSRGSDDVRLLLAHRPDVVLTCGRTRGWT